jgi:uncharacterized pyridoxamine 5'-phosphate oxidase family protein
MPVPIYGLITKKIQILFSQIKENKLICLQCQKENDVSALLSGKITFIFSKPSSMVDLLH